MNKSERIKKIFEVISQEGNASTKYLAELLGVSEATVRRDIVNLESDGEIPMRRVRGGIVFSLDKSGFEPMFDLKLSNMIEEKKKIAQIALDQIDDGDSIFLDSGTTIYYLAKIMGSKKGIKAVVVDLKVAEELSKHPNIRTIVACGSVRSGYYSIGGNETVNFLNQFHVEKSFIATDGWNLAGTFNSSDFEVEIKRKMIALSEKRYLLADHSKYGKNAFIKVSDLKEFDVLITDRDLPKDVTEYLNKNGIKILC
ncbi:DeoR/GlpR family DNA-binding transcription regulator [Athalassotoga saccharophila]|uniref:DeoR/GlpR family DNA-binding transcription regulator n=1 Tax=Athalassotoga saccharophila TaxID=1441386 RepID=UPI00137B4646|nr:DeoR/GlpR family DNA-binding transcription regulator [Athalassotoga saccharophila]BBJ27524.1 glycerol-3-phosphate regulon repressor [Athalassotoga saccharophila]